MRLILFFLHLRDAVRLKYRYPTVSWRDAMEQARRLRP